MELTFNDKIYKFTFGFHFLKEVNKKYRMVRDGVEISLGIANTAVGLQIGDMEVLLDTLLIANQTEAPRLKENDFEAMLTAYEPEKLFEMVLNELETSVFTKQAMKKATSQQV